ncbi:GntR family transcriptional regulator, partial [Pseudomonas savastanoi pv. glycinea]
MDPMFFNLIVRQQDKEIMLSFSRPQSLVEGVVSTIRKEIASGGLPADSKMPTEHELADQFGVSRSVVREAIS